jgi:hypothetical protein
MEAATARINLGDLTAELNNAAAAVERWADDAAADAAAARAAHVKKLAELEGESVMALSPAQARRTARSWRASGAKAMRARGCERRNKK